MVRSALGDVARSVNEAAALGGFDRADSHLTRSRLTLDEQGWKELADVLKALVDRTEKIGAESERRLRKNDHAGERQATLVMMLFEGIPSVDGAPAADGAEDGGRPRTERNRKRRQITQAPT